MKHLMQLPVMRFIQRNSLILQGSIHELYINHSLYIYISITKYKYVTKPLMFQSDQEIIHENTIYMITCRA